MRPCSAHNSRFVIHNSNMTHRTKKIVSFCILSLVLFVVAIPGFAQMEGLDKAVEGTGLDKAGSGQTGVAKIIATVLNVLFSLLGAVFLLLLVYAGFLWMTSQGESKDVDKAKGIIKNAVLGLVVTLAAYAITAFVMSRIVTPLST